jgi:DNA-binding NarL/FixJ family response regulator
MAKIKVFLVDDHKIVRDGLKSILASSSKFVFKGEDSHPQSFMKLLPGLEVDIIVLDISLPSISGIDLIKKIKELKPSTKVVMLSMHNEPEYIFRSLREGANAYLPKDIEAEEFLNALLQVHLKGSYFPKNINFTKQVTPAPYQDEAPQSAVLTQREIEILEFMVKGLSSKEIAKDLSISPRTIETHRLNIMKKLGTSNSAETVAMAVKKGLLRK